MTALADMPTIYEALAAVMGDVMAVGKTGINQQQHYNFRGVDAVVNAVGPALRNHGVIVCPHAESVEYETYTTKNGTVMKSCVVRVRFVFHGPGGDWLEATVFGESSDSGDKSTPKAHSVAFRTALLQALCIPTDEPDPDESSHERATLPPAGPPPGPPWPDGWNSEQEWLDAWDELRGRTGRIPDEQDREQVKAWLKAEKITKNTLTPDRAEVWAQQVDRVTPAEEPA